MKKRGPVKVLENFSGISKDAGFLAKRGILYTT